MTLRIAHIVCCVLLPLSGADDDRQGRSDRFGFVVWRIGDSALTVPLTRQPGWERLVVRMTCAWVQKPVQADRTEKQRYHQTPPVTYPSRTPEQRESLGELP